MFTPQPHYDIADSSAKNVLLSIITVTRNDYKRLNITLSSMACFYGDHRFEHIIIDGKSTDETRILLEKNSCHKNFKYLSESDIGIYDAMNKGARLAKGSYLLFLNCGDQMFASPNQVNSWLHPLLIEDKIDIACFCYQQKRGGHNITLIPRLSLPYRMPTSHQAMVFSEKFTQKHPYNTRYKIAADFDLYIKAEKLRVLLFDELETLTCIESIGIASQNPHQSYKEYLYIARENLHGCVKWSVIIIIGVKAIAAILLKKSFLGKWFVAPQRNV